MEDRLEGEQLRRWRLGLAFTVVGVVGLVWGRSALAAWDRSHVHVVADANALTCTGSKVERGTGSPFEDDDEIPIAAIERDMRCDYAFSIENHGGEGIHLRSVRFAVLGPGGGVPAEAVTLDPHGVRPRQAKSIESPTPLDAIFDVDVDLPAHRTRAFTLHIAYRPGGCMAADSWTTFQQTPQLTLRSRGVSGQRAAETHGFGFRGHPTLNCDGPRGP